MTDENSADNGITPEERQLIEELSSNAKAGSTRKRYASAMEKFYDWLKGRKESDELPISSGLVLVYLSELSKELSKSTLNIVVSAIRHAHQTAEFDSPTDGQGVKELMQGISRQKKGDPQTQAPAMTREVLENIKKTACKPSSQGQGQGQGQGDGEHRPGTGTDGHCAVLHPVLRHDAHQRGAGPVPE